MRRARNDVWILGAAAAAMLLGSIHAALADPDSPFASARMVASQLEKTTAPWERSQVKIPDYIATAASTTPAGSLGVPVTGLDGVSTGSAGLGLSGIAAGLAGANAALSVSVGAIGGGVNGAGAGVSAGGSSGGQGALSGLAGIGLGRSPR